MRLLLVACCLGRCSALSVNRRAAIARVAGGTAAITSFTPPALAAAVPEGCRYTGEGEYQYQLGNGNLDCSAGFIAGFAGEELVFTPFLLAGIYAAGKAGMLPDGLQDKIDNQVVSDGRRAMNARKAERAADRGR